MVPRILIPRASVEVPYGRPGVVSVYIGSSQIGFKTVEKDFTNYLDLHRFYKEKNVRGFCKFILFGAENSDRDDYIKINNHVKVFVGNKLFMKYVILDVDVNTWTEETVVSGFDTSQLLAERLTDSATFAYTDIPSNQIITDIASGNITIIENEDLGRITQTWSFKNMLDAITQVTDYLGGIWWISQDHPYDIDFLNVSSHKGSISVKKRFFADGSNVNIFGSTLIIDRENFINSAIVTNSSDSPTAIISAVSTIYSKLSLDTFYDAGAKSLLVQIVDMKDFPATGIISVGDERIPYTSISGNGIFSVRDDSYTGYEHRKGVLAFLTYNGIPDPPNNPHPTTTLSSAINSTVTTIPVADSSGFTNTGTIIIADEVIQYTGNTGTSFTGCTRKLGSLVSWAHAINVVVFEYFPEDHYTKTVGILYGTQAGSSINKWGLKEKKIVDDTMTARVTQEAYASTIVESALEELSDAKGGLASVRFNVAEPLDIAKEIDIDDTIYVEDIDNDVANNLRVINMELSETQDFGFNLIIEAGNKKRTFVNTLINKLQGKYG